MPSRNETSQANQTEFVDQARFLENKSTKFFTIRDFKNNKSLRPFYALIIVLFSILLLTVLAVFFKKNPQEAPVIKQTEKDVRLDPLNQRVYELKEDLKEHNPTKQTLPFPRVDLEFNIN